MWSRVATGGIDLAAPGKQCLSVRLSFSPAGELTLPLVIVRNGRGPTVLTAGGTHGDEFEGQITVSNLCRDIAPENVQGTLILPPLHNVLACKAGTRLTPDDGSDLNRLYGGPEGDGPAHA